MRSSGVSVGLSIVHHSLLDVLTVLWICLYDAPVALQALSVGLGISVMNPSDMSKENGFADEAPSAPKPPPKPAPKAEPEPEMNDEEKAAKRRKEEAMEEKTKGNEYYKKKEFAEAIKCYEAALNLDDTDISFLTNK